MRTSIFVLTFALISVNSHAQKTAEECFNLGMIKMSERQFDSAEFYFNKALLLKPDYADAAFRRGLIKDNSGKPEEAYADYTLAIEIEPKAVYYNNRGILRFVQGENTSAISDYDSAIALDPNYLIAVFNKGKAYIEMEEFKEGCKFMTEAYQRGLSVAKDAVNYYCN